VRVFIFLLSRVVFAYLGSWVLIYVFSMPVFGNHLLSMIDGASFDTLSVICCLCLSMIVLACL
jgi:hypothetical protein